MDDRVVRLVTVVCLTVIVVTGLVGITIVALNTDRDVHYAEGLSFGGALLVAVLGGFNVAAIRRRRRHRWRLERDDEDGAD